MACYHPPPLSDEEINLALDSVAPDDVNGHLAACAECSARLDDLRRFEQHARGALYRWDCPAPEQLGVYHMGLLTGTEERAIARHLTLCVRCADEVEVLRSFLAGDTAPQPQVVPDDAPPWQVRTPLSTMVARIAPRLGWGAVRGGGQAPTIAQSDVATIILDPIPQAPTETMLVGQIADDQDDQDRWTGALVAAYLKGAFVGAAVVDDLGSFTCGPLPEGIVDIFITSETGPTIQIPGVAI